MMRGGGCPWCPGSVTMSARGRPLMEIAKIANLAVRFGLELAALAAMGYWGFRVGEGWVASVALGLGVPLIAALAWGIFVSPRATVPVSPPLHLALQVA